MVNKGFWQRFFNPNQRGRRRWIIFGVLFLFLLSFFINITGSENIFSRNIDHFLSQTPVVSNFKIWPKIEISPLTGGKRLAWKNIKEINLSDYGFPFRLGLDLQGGAHLVYQADVSDIPSGEQANALAGVRDVIERRVNAIGVSEPVVQTNRVGDYWRVIVELAGVHDVNQAIAIIGETPLLEFKEENPIASQLTLEEQNLLDQANQIKREEAENVLGQILAGADFDQLAREYSEDFGSRDQGGLYTNIVRGMFVPEYEEVVFDQLSAGEIYPELVETIFGYHIIKKEAVRGEGDGLEIDTRHILFQYINPEDLGIMIEPEWLNTNLTGKELRRARVEFDQMTGVPQVALEFNSEGTELFAEITRRNTGKLVAIFLDGEAISIPRVNEPILSGQAVISGNFNLKEAKLLAQRLNAGALPVPINLISQTTVGATLGNESVQRSLNAAFWGFILVAIFMILYYRLPGILAVLALVIYATLVLCLFQLIPVTLTLAGIAGFILSIGMAVDANILIFERLKEELSAGRSMGLAIDGGFHRAWSSIRDSNISSLITCIILFWFGTSIIKGFALTLSIGILVSMFSAIIITKQFLLLTSNWGWAEKLWLYGVKKK